MRLIIMNSLPMRLHIPSSDAEIHYATMFPGVYFHVSFERALKVRIRMKSTWHHLLSENNDSG